MEIQSLQREVQNQRLEKEDNIVRMQLELCELATTNDRLHWVNSSLSTNGLSLAGNVSRYNINGYNVPLTQQVPLMEKVAGNLQSRASKKC